MQGHHNIRRLNAGQLLKSNIGTTPQSANPISHACRGRMRRWMNTPLILLLVLSMVLSIPTQAQFIPEESPEEATLEKVGLQGAIKEVRAHIYYLDPKLAGDGELQAISQVFFDEAGYMVRKTHLNSEGEKDEEWTYSYDENHNLIKQTEEQTTPNSVIYTKVAKFDKKGKMVSGESFNPNGSPAISRQLTYNDHGVITEIKDDLKNDNASRKWIYFYDENGKKVEERIFLEGKLFELQQFEYDEQDQLIELTGYIGEDEQIERKITYEYDDRGNRVKEFEIGYDPDGSEGSELNREIIYEGNQKVEVNEKYSETEGGQWYKSKDVFDQYGNPIKESREHSIESLSFDRRHNYKYDNQGNWVVKEVVDREGPTTIVERKIIYY